MVKYVASMTRNPPCSAHSPGEEKILSHQKCAGIVGTTRKTIKRRYIAILLASLKQLQLKKTAFTDF